jgi:hypothetical protein
MIEVALPGVHSWRLDNRAGRLSRDGAQVATLINFSSFGARAPGDFLFVGSDDDEEFNMSIGDDFWAPGQGSVEVRMNGGDDQLYFNGGAPVGRFDGGDGIDRFDFNGTFGRPLPPHTQLVFNLTTGLLRDTSARGETTRRATHFENARVSNGNVPTAGPTTLKGTSGANRLRVWGPGPATIYGKAGTDELRGANGDDVFNGGSGHDAAYGQGGVDSCNAEIRIDCEL